MSDTPRSRLRVRPRHVVRWIAVVVVLVLAATVAYAVYNYQHFVGGITHIDAIPAASSAASSSSGQNILLVGDDHRPANASAQELAELGTTADGGGTNTDSMMVLHIPSNGAKATLVSLPRDSWVSIPGHGMGKLNAAFAYGSASGGDAGGAQLLVKTVENVSGLHIDHFVRISMLGFYDVAKALDPLRVCLNDAVDDPYSTFVAPKGESTLDAMQTLAFVRQRHGLPGGDLDREARQRYFLSAEMKNVLSPSTLLNPGKLNGLLTAVSGAIQTDPGLDFLGLATQLKDLAGGNLQSATIPISGTPTIYYDGSAVSIVKVDEEAMPAFVAKLDQKATSSGSSAAPAAPAAVAPSSVKVTVLNGSGQSGAAATNSSTLEKVGFAVGTPGTVSTRSGTTIQYPASMGSQASTLAKYVPGATLEAVTGVASVTLVLGTDGVVATTKASAGAGAGSSGGAASGASAPAAAAAPAAGVPCLN
ncbi:Transcriptional regulator LytR [Frondihabitans sp. 762G35]|uniref:LCP family protein n=1 Tax=Frondihabitans sp. 762G35 TaxID=1446794 RepID=UPI000D21F85B|nr:LCP family protein [Frondihabitans sp. 762G35]ARC56488.1 Transcriptional regulator LytR [Frondihabitans sp. 762G35]